MTDKSLKQPSSTAYDTSDILKKNCKINKILIMTHPHTGYCSGHKCNLKWLA